MTEQHTCFADLHLQRKVTINSFKMHISLMLSVILHNEPMTRKELLDMDILKNVSDVNEIFRKLIHETADQFPHVGISTYSDLTVRCKFCDKALGWKCPDNPNGYCEYDYEQENPQDWEICIHCGRPEERK